MTPLATRLAREPLLYFLLAGAALLAVDRWRHPPGDERNIAVSAQTAEALYARFEQRSGAPPTAAERRRLLEDHVAEEVLYREALALGFDEGDLIIRRRLVQKMEYLLEDLAPAPEPDEAELEGWLAAHAEDYRRPAQVAFDHVYFRRQRLEEDPEVIQRALAALSPEEDALAAAALGDGFMHRASQRLRPLASVGADFGGDFAQALLSLPVGAWSGPVESAYGLHLVRVVEIAPARPARLDEVRAAVVRDRSRAQREQAREAQLRERVARYRVVVE